MTACGDGVYANVEMNKEESLDSVIHTFNITFHDEHEDAYTQTDTHCSQKSASAFPAFELEVPQVASEESVSTELSFYEPQYWYSPTTRKHTNQFYKDKTPNTLKMLKEKHRENERLRHHSLNQHLRQICKKVPGSAEDGKETKVVMMQRIISYIAYLENSLQFMSSKLSIRPASAWRKLTSSVKDIEKSGTWRNEFVGISSDDSVDSEVFKGSTTRRLKLSSPTIDSTTDPGPSKLKPIIMQPVKIEKYSQESQDSSFPTSSLYVDMEDSTSDECQAWSQVTDVAIDGQGNFDALLTTPEYDDQIFYELPSSTFETKLMKTPDEVKWLGSPDISPNSPQGHPDSHFGIKCDPACLDEQPLDFSHTVTVSPDQVMPQTTIKKEMVQADNTFSVSSSLSSVQETQIIFAKSADPSSEPSYSDMSYTANPFHSRSKKRKQASPRRMPLLDIANWTKLPVEASQDLNVSDWPGYNREARTALAVCTAGSEVKIESSSGVKSSQAAKDLVKIEPDNSFSDVTRSGLSVENMKLPRDANGEPSSKLDLRKSSWMNGFMMFSRIHRRNFIRENPGLHTSAISKIMGHTWRQMSSKQQEPYREQACLCSQELQRVLDKSSID